MISREAGVRGPRTAGEYVIPIILSSGARMKNHRLMLSGLLWISLGCVGPNHRPAATTVAGPPQHIEARSYTIGEVIRVEPGKTMIRVKDYWIQQPARGNVILDRQVTLVTENGVTVLPHGRVLRNLGPIDIENVIYNRYVDASDDDGISPICYARPDGSMADFIYVRGRSGQFSGFAKLINRPNITYKFPPPYPAEIVPEREHDDYTLLFRYWDEKLIHVTCMDAANPERTEELAFPSNEKRISFRNLRFELQPSAPGELAFRVLSD